MYATLSPDTIEAMSPADRLRAIEALHRAAYSDSLTGVGNRKALEERRFQAQGCKYVFYLDLDGLKTVNDTQGHDAGDAFICRSVEALCAIFRRDEDRIYRTGGDEFVVLSSYQPDLSTLTMFSIGVATIGDGDLEAAIKVADRAMYEVKRSRKSR